MAHLVITDTDVVLDFFTDTPPFAQALTYLLQEGRLAVTAITVFELYAGVLGAKRRKQIETFCESVPVFNLCLLAAAYVGKIYTESNPRLHGMNAGTHEPETAHVY